MKRDDGEAYRVRLEESFLGGPNDEDVGGFAGHASGRLRACVEVFQVDESRRFLCAFRFLRKKMSNKNLDFLKSLSVG